MQERHIDRKRYFNEQAQTCRNYYIPYIKSKIEYLPDKVLEVGCGEEHQQIAKGKIISHLPFIHLLPRFLCRWLLKLCGEKDDTIKELLNIKQTKCSVEIFRNIAKQAGYQIMNEQLYLFNPHYEVKFGFPPRKLSKGISMIPYVRDFFSTSCFIGL